MYDVGAQLPKNGANHIDAHHSRQPLVKGERLVRYEVHAVIVSVLQLMECVYLKFNNDFKLKHVEEEEGDSTKGRPQARSRHNYCASKHKIPHLGLLLQTECYVHATKQIDWASPDQFPARNIM